MNVTSASGRSIVRVQPVFQACNQPSPSLWRRLRHDHLLPPKMAAAAESEAAAAAAPLVPPSTPLIPWDWVVVVHDKVLTSIHNAPRFMVMLRQFFRAERILVFASGKSVQEGAVQQMSNTYCIVHS